MRKLFFILPVMLVFPALAGCGANPGTAELPTASPAPTATTAPATWKIVRTIAYTHSVNYAGFLNGDFGITVGTAGEVHYTTDGGTSWPRAQNNSMCRYGLEIVDSQVAWHCGNGGMMRLSTDSGKTWQAAAATFGADTPDQCRFLSFLDATTGWAGTHNVLGMTTDGGATWTNIPLPAGVQRIEGLDLRTPTRGYLLGSDGILYTTSDAGANWKPMALDFTKDAYLLKTVAPTAVVRFPDENHGVIVLSRGTAAEGFHLWAATTSDSGSTWTTEQLPTGTGKPNLFLSRDGITLTVLNDLAKTITIFQSGS